MARSETRVFPALLRHWRTRRGLSQLDLALAADVSARHVSFLETGRAAPSREMVLRLGGALGVPLRDQNQMLAAAGFPEEFAQPKLETLPDPIVRAIDRMLAQQEPFPMTVLDRRWDVVRTNEAATRLLLRFVAEPDAMPSRLNVMQLLFDPRLGRSFVLEWERVAHAVISRLHREALARPEDTDLAALLRSLFEYPDVPESWRQPDFASAADPVFVLKLRRGDLALSFLTTLTVFSSPGDVTLEELRIESYFPLDDATARACEALR
jgi:transcriptional regulator with XRE-family HTH domain